LPHRVRWGPSSPPPKGRSPQFSAHVCCAQTAGWIKMPLGTEVGLGPGDIVLDGDSAHPPPKGYSPLPNFRSMFIVAKRSPISATAEALVAYHTTCISLCMLYMGWQWRNFFIPYLCQVIYRHDVGQAPRSVCYCDITFLVKAKFHYASWFEAGRRPAASWNLACHLAC